MKAHKIVLLRTMLRADLLKMEHVGRRHGKFQLLTADEVQSEIKRRSDIDRMWHLK